jgi:hypothetical protein
VLLHSAKPVPVFEEAAIAGKVQVIASHLWAVERSTLVDRSCQSVGALLTQPFVARMPAAPKVQGRL